MVCKFCAKCNIDKDEDKFQIERNICTDCINIKTNHSNYYNSNDKKLDIRRSTKWNCIIM